MMHLALSLSPFGHHPAAWRRSPLGHSALAFPTLAAQVQRAQGARLDFVLLDDAQTQRPVSELPAQTVPFEPTLLVAALATVARQIGLVATSATGQHELYNLARRYASLDLISQGRVGWNVVPSGPSAEWNQEYVEVVRALWGSWEPDAFVYDKVAGRFFRPDKMHVLQHRGPHFTVRGPLNVNPSPQGWPVIAQALSDSGLALAAAMAEVVFVSPAADGKGSTWGEPGDRLLRERGRSRAEIRVLASVMPWIGASRAQATADAELFDALLPAGAAGVTGRQVFGTAAEVADALQELYERHPIDGFVILPARVPEGLDAFMDGVVPELQRRGLFRLHYQGSTLRDHLALAKPRPRASS